MSKEQYEWVVAIALSLHKPDQPSDQNAGDEFASLMRIITALGGQVYTERWDASNDPELSAGQRVARVMFLLVLQCAKSHVLLMPSVYICAKFNGVRRLFANPDLSRHIPVLPSF